MPIFHESDLTFSFPNDWTVKKFDSTKFYKYLSGYGLKGVDFIVISPKEELILIEVKNYYNRWNKNEKDIASSFEKNLHPFSKKISEKFKDSFRLLKIVEKYYQRKMCYNWILIPLFKKYPKLFSLKTNWIFWLMAHKLYKNKKVKLNLILCLPQNISNPKDFTKTIATIVSKDLKFHHFEIILHKGLHQVVAF